MPIQSQVVTAATGTISTGLAFPVAATMAAPLAYAVRGANQVDLKSRLIMA